MERRPAFAAIPALPPRPPRGPGGMSAIRDALGFLGHLVPAGALVLGALGLAHLRRAGHGPEALVLFAGVGLVAALLGLLLLSLVQQLAGLVARALGRRRPLIKAR
jgi:hypothetical protein